jgi:hypothetical protein
LQRPCQGEVDSQAAAHRAAHEQRRFTQFQIVQQGDYIGQMSEFAGNRFATAVAAQSGATSIRVLKKFVDGILV